MAVCFAVGSFTIIAAALTTQDDKLLPLEKLKVIGGYLFSSIWFFVVFMDSLHDWLMLR